jgi:hypothetical protein
MMIDFTFRTTLLSRCVSRQQSESRHARCPQGAGDVSLRHVVPDTGELQAQATRLLSGIAACLPEGLAYAKSVFDILTQHTGLNAQRESALSRRFEHQAESAAIAQRIKALKHSRLLRTRSRLAATGRWLIWTNVTTNPISWNGSRGRSPTHPVGSGTAVSHP